MKQNKNKFEISSRIIFSIQLFKRQIETQLQLAMNKVDNIINIRISYLMSNIIWEEDKKKKKLITPWEWFVGTYDRHSCPHSMNTVEYDLQCWISFPKLFWRDVDVLYIRTKADSSDGALTDHYVEAYKSRKLLKANRVSRRRRVMTILTRQRFSQ